MSRTSRAALPSLAAALCLSVLLPAEAHAVPDRGMDPTPPKDADSKQPKGKIPKHRLYYSNATFARVNPLGLISVGQLGWRRRLADKPASNVLFGDTYTYVAAVSRVSPAFGRLGAHLEVSPIAIFKAWVDLEGVGYFGTFDQVTGFSDASPAYDDDSLDAMARGLPTGGWVFTGGAVLQAKAGPVAVRSTFQATRFSIGLPDGEEYFYDQIWDRLAPNNGFMLLNDADVMGVFEHARVGTRWTWTDGLVDDPDSLAGMAHHRVGPLFAWQFSEGPPGKRFNRPTLFTLVQWWLQHPYRDGTEQSQAMPLVAVGFAFQGDLLGAPATGR